MSLTEILRALGRRKYVTITGVVLSALLAGAVATLVPNDYSSDSTIVLTQPRRPGTASYKNPMLGGESNVNSATLELMNALDSPEVRTQLGLDGSGENFTAKNVPSASVADVGDHPFLYINAVAHTPERASSIVEDVVQAGRNYLQTSQRERNAQRSYLIEIQTVVDATPPKAVLTTRLSLTGAAFLLGLVLTTTLACLVDGRRRRRRDSQRAHTEPTPAVEHPDGPPNARLPHPRPRDTTIVNISRDELHDELTRLGWERTTSIVETLLIEARRNGRGDGTRPPSENNHVPCENNHAPPEQSWLGPGRRSGP
ncbi:MAG TPA: hypothetical protein VH141_00335 [Pseudonocardia sp.]|jgi:capsular polysaccharide biosynthesis protein|nr:hypothetical protein [Pseudonocardia sp.]